jgi:hypothetical protein
MLIFFLVVKVFEPSLDDVEDTIVAMDQYHTHTHTHQAYIASILSFLPQSNKLEFLFTPYIHLFRG